MYHNNIAENSSTRVAAPPGGKQSFNIFGGSDDHVEEPQRGRGRRQQQEPQTFTPVEPTRPVRSPHDSTNLFVADPITAPTRDVKVVSPYAGDAPEAAVQNKPARAAPVNNIWGSDDVQNKPSTRVLNRPGGGSAGVSAVFGGDDTTSQRPSSKDGARSNATSANNPFSGEATQSTAHSGKRGNPNAAAARSSGNILSWD
jgi:hypothetical protein